MKKININEILEKKEIPKILIIRLHPLGDTVLITPVIYVLKKTYPHSKITIIISKRFSGVVKTNPYINEIIEYDRRIYPLFLISMLTRKFDISIDFINNPRSSIITLFVWARFRFGLRKPRNFFYNVRKPLTDHKDYIVEKSLSILIPLGIENPSIHFYYQPDTEAVDYAEAYLRKRNFKGKILGLYVSASSLTQKWPLDRFLELGNTIMEHFDVGIMILWGPEDHAVIETLARDHTYSEKFLILPSTSINQMGAFFQKCSIVVTGDGGPKHMAVALDIPTLTIYGSIEARYWNPPDLQRFPVIASDSHCYPCHDKKGCRYNTYECLHSIPVESVFEIVSQLVKTYM